MSRIAAVAMLSLLCQLVAACSPADVPQGQVVESSAEQVAEVGPEPTSPPAEEGTQADAAEAVVIVEKVYGILAEDGSQVGSFALMALETAEDVVVVVDMSMDRDGSSVRAVTAVNYGLSGEPVSGRARTFIDGRVCMVGTIEFGEATYSYSGRGVRDDGSGDILDRTVYFGAPEMTMPAGPIVFMTDFAVMAPRLLTEAGTLEGVTVVEFPDDIGPTELVRMKDGWLAVRDEADDEGNVTFSLSNRHPVTVTGPDGVTTEEDQTEVVSTVTYDVNGEIVDCQLSDEWRLVEVAQDEPVEDGEPAEGEGAAEDAVSKEGDDD